MNCRQLLLAVATLSLVVAGFAQPARFNYQAKLTTATGQPLQGTHSMYFSLYAGGSPVAADDGTLLFKESASVDVSDGVANHSIGTGVNVFGGALTSAMLKTGGDIYVQVAVDADAPGNVVIPRTRLDSVPYALASADGDARTALTGPAPITISSPGSYYLAGNLDVTAGNGIVITSGRVTLDLNGFSINSTETTPTGTGILFGGAVSDVTITNGHIAGGVTYSADVFSGPGFLDGVGFSPSPPLNVMVSKLTISRCKRYGINLNGVAVRNMVDSCIVRIVGKDGITANTVVRSCAQSCGENAIVGVVVSDCLGEAITKSGIDTWTALNCYAYSRDYYGFNVYSVENCFGQSTNNDAILANTVAASTGFSEKGNAIYSGSVENSYGSSTDKYGVWGYTVNNCNGYSAHSNGVQADFAVTDSNGESNISGDGVSTSGTATNCRGTAVNGRGVYAEKAAQNCFGESTTDKKGLEGGMVTNSQGVSNTGVGLTFTKAGAMVFGERKMPPATNQVLGGGQAGPINLP